MRVITRGLDFHGNREDYYDPRNSLLPDVLERRMGLPIMLCMVCIALGRRLGVRIEGLGFPSHFLAVFRTAAGDTILDPFLGLTLDPTEVERHLARLLGQPVNLAPEFWRAADVPGDCAPHPAQPAQRLPDGQGPGNGRACA